MNRQQFEKLMVKYRSVKNGDIEKCGKRMNEVWNWINQNYISKEQILNLECLKEEKDREQRGSSIDYNFDVEIKNQLRNEIIEEINKL